MRIINLKYEKREEQGTFGRKLEGVALVNKKDRKYWDIGLENFKKFFKEEGHPFVPMRKKGMHGNNSSFKDAAYTYGFDNNGEPFKLGAWIVYARTIYKNWVQKPDVNNEEKKRRVAQLKESGFFLSSDIKILLTQHIEESYADIDTYLKMIETIISNKLKVQTNIKDGGCIHRISLEKLRDDVDLMEDNIEPVSRHDAKDIIKEYTRALLDELEDEINTFEKANARIRLLRDKIREI